MSKNEAKIPALEEMRKEARYIPVNLKRLRELKKKENSSITTLPHMVAGNSSKNLPQFYSEPPVKSIAILKSRRDNGDDSVGIFRSHLTSDEENKNKGEV